MKAEIWDCGARAEFQPGQQGGYRVLEAQPAQSVGRDGVRQVLIVLISADVSVIDLRKRELTV